MITVNEAEKIIASSLPRYPSVKTDLKNAYGAILREDIRADRDLPPINRAVLDGIAINFDAFKRGQKSFRIQGVQPAGYKPLKLKSKQYCVEIMTGAPVPPACDCVIGVENISVEKGYATVSRNYSAARGQHIRRRAADYRRGALLLRKGIILGANQIAVIASVGKKHVQVNARLKIAVISTGDELVDVGHKIQPYQVRLSNSYALQAAFQRTGLFDASTFHIKDNKRELSVKIKKILAAFDVIVLSGGVSMGKFDYVPMVLKQLGTKVLFHKIKQKPGKPFWYGLYKGRQPVFALPGNPVSTLVCAYRFVIPQLKEALGLQSVRPEQVALARPFYSKTDLVYYLPVKLLQSKEGKRLADPVGISGSGDFVALAKADGFVQVPPGHKKSSVLSFYPFI